MFKTRSTLQHVAVGIVGNGEEMRRHVVAPFSLIPVNDTQRVDGNASIRVDDHAEKTGIRLQSHAQNQASLLTIIKDYEYS